MEHRDPHWTIDELGDRIEIALAASDYEGAPNGRIRSVPDRRTIRYYTTLGLLDRPAAWRGRTALYGTRHLRQIVAIKRLQSRGLSLAEIQQRLAGLPETDLARIARLPDLDRLLDAGAADDGSGGDAAGPGSTRSRSTGAFWAEPLALPAAMAPEEDTEDDRAPAAAETAPLHAVRLDDGVVLLVDPGTWPDDLDLAALRAAAGPMLRMLRAPDATGSSQEGEES